jgi:hypothetical protein
MGVDGAGVGRAVTAISGGDSPMTLAHYQSAFLPLLYGVALAIILTMLLRETGSAAGAVMRMVAAVTPLRHRQEPGSTRISWLAAAASIP